MDQAPRVAVLVETSTSWGRRLIRGIGNYVQSHQAWRLTIEPLGINQRVRLPAGWRGEGIIARVNTPTLARQLAGTGVPVVNISGVELPGVKFPCVKTDERRIAELAVGHLQDQGIKRFAYCGESRRGYARGRVEVFSDVVAAAGHECRVFWSNRPAGRNRWRDGSRDLVGWIKRHPDPVGILAWNAISARRVAEACLVAGLRVPDEAAIISVDTDDLLGEVVRPSLSGVRLSMERIGYEAAALLAAMMAGKPPPREPLLIEPQAVVARQSTDILAIDDPLLRDAIRFIRDHDSEPIGVPDVLRAVPIARRVLERRFKEVIGRSPAQEIRRVHIERAKKLLSETHLPIPKVAEASGFRYVEHMILVFRKKVGDTPLAYRKRVQAG